MLFLIISWVLILAPCLTLGISILKLTGATCFERTFDRLIASIWIGLAILSPSMLAVSLFLPLNPLVGAAAAICCFGVPLISSQVRDELNQLSRHASIKNLSIVIASVMIAAALAVRPVIKYDTGLYHFQSLRWLSEYGAVHGLALIHFRFGFVSSWFALAAPFETAIFETRAAVVLSGFVIFLATLQLLFSISLLISGRARTEDWFIAISPIFFLPYARWDSYLPASLSPDLPIIVMTPVIAWMILIISNKNLGVLRALRGSRLCTNVRRFDLADPTIIPLLVSSGAVTIKLNAAPLLVVSMLYYLNRNRLRRLLFGASICALMIAPVSIFGVIVSGCPFYPSSLMCFDLPWAVGAESAREAARLIQNYARWSATEPLSGYHSWLEFWFKTELSSVFLLIFSIVSSLGLMLIRGERRIRGQGWLVFLGFIGISFVMVGSPAIRFAFGYFILAPILLIVLYREIAYPLIPLLPLGAILLLPYIDLHLRRFRLGLLLVALAAYLLTLFYQERAQLRNVPLFFVLLAVVLPLQTVFVSVRENIFTGRDWARLLLPPRLPMPEGEELIRKQVNDVRYVTPRSDLYGDQCWAAEIPCTPQLENERIRLRDPARGVGGGVIRVGSHVIPQSSAPKIKR